MTAPLKLVVADDEPDLCEFYQTVLSDAGHQVSVALTGRQLVELCRFTRPDLVITDVKMPEMDGIAAVKAVCKERPVPAILVSGYSDPVLVERAAVAPVLAYLVKPVRPEDLLPAIATAMRLFAEFQALQQEAAHLRQTLEERKVIEHAKGILMKRLKLDEGEAFRRLQKTACAGNHKVIDVAREVLKAEQVFRSLPER